MFPMPGPTAGHLLLSAQPPVSRRHRFCPLPTYGILSAMPQIWWPALIVGLILGFYWGRVVKLVLKAKSRGESAHFF